VARRVHPRLALALPLAVFLSRGAFAQSEPPPPGTSTPPPLAPSPLTAAPAPEPAPPAGSCFPACREGFVCNGSQCVSVCNPPCPEGQTCIEGRRCDIAPPPGNVHEPPPPPVLTFAERSHSLLAFHYGFPTELEVADSDGPRDSVLGINLRTDTPIAKYVLVGPMLEFSWFEPGYMFDLDLYLRARAPIDAGSTKLQLWAGVPIGLTFDFLSDDFARRFSPDLDGFALGWNVGVLFGGAVHLSKEFGLFSEFGWQQHRASHGREANGNVQLVLQQWIMNLGLVFRG
jgi:hypothetical protein